MNKRGAIYLIGVVMLYILIDVILFSFLPSTTLLQVATSLLLILIIGGTGLYLLQKFKNNV